MEHLAQQDPLETTKEQIVEEVKEREMKFHFPETMKEVSRLALFNALCADEPDSVDIWERRMESLQKEELWAKSHKNLIPSIGLELEIPSRLALFPKTSLLTDLEIDNELEPNDDEYWETRTNPSFSARVQSRFLMELAKFGHISEDDVNTSLHINFGIPKDLDMSPEPKEFRMFTDVLTFAFVDSCRLKQRKTQTSFVVKKTGMIDSPDFSSTHRLEIRTPDFKDKHTFRLIEESQLLYALLLSSLESGVTDSTMSTFELEKRLELRELWRGFEVEVKNKFSQRGIPMNGSYDTDASGIALFLRENLDFVLDLRNLITRYVNLTKKIINKKIIEE